jgi:hypothetical protein
VGGAEVDYCARCGAGFAEGVDFCAHLVGGGGFVLFCRWLTDERGDMEGVLIECR